MKKFLSILIAASLMGAFVACEEDETTPDGPSITAPAITDAQVGTSADVTFAVTVPGGFKSYEVTAATGGTAAKKSEPASGATSGEIVVTYTADATPGAGSITLAVTDNNDKV